MYLSKILVTGAACRNAYEIHRALWGLFPEDNDADRDFLFRVEKSDGRQAEILMQSIREPRLIHNETRLIAIREYSFLLRAGQMLRFLLIANPVKTINDEKVRKNAKGEIKKCRVPLIDDEAQRVWIGRKLEHVASLETLVIDRKLPLYFRKQKDQLTGKIQPVIYQGILKVQNPDALQKLIQDGIGPAKAFGCGLLSLARA
jgi:CRISPR system Cascade subunit CasE